MRDNKAYEFWKARMGDEKHDIHCNAVIKACLGMIKNTDLVSDVFIVAGWIHDMGKLNDKENHHVESLKFLEEFLSENPEFEKFRVEIEDCILNHRKSRKPETIYGQIFQVADKVALRDREWLEYKKII